MFYSRTNRSSGFAALPWVLLLVLFCLVGLSSRRQLSYEDEAARVWVVTGADLLLPKGDGFQLVSGLMVQGRGDRIEAIGTPGECPEVPADAVRIDGTGATLLQGLMDAWCNVTDPTDLDRALSAGVTTLRVMDSPSWLSRVLAQRALDGTVTPHCLYFGSDVRRHISRADAEEGLTGAALRKAVHDDMRGQIANGVDGFTLGHDGTPELLKFAAATARRFNLPLAVRSPGKIPFGNALFEADAVGTLEAFLGDWLVLEKKTGQPKPLPSRRTIKGRVAQVVKAGHPVVTGLIEHVRTTHLVGLEAELPARDFVQNRYGERDETQLIVPKADLASLPPLTRARWSQAAHQVRRSVPLPFVENMRRALPLLASMAKQLIEADAALVVGTGAGAPFILMGTAVVEEIELLREIGMDPAASIAAASTRSAALMGLGGVGSLRLGSRADLILVEGNPLTDVDALRRVRAVAVSGRWVTAEQLAARREADRKVLEGEMDFVRVAAIESIGGTADELRDGLAAFAAGSGTIVRRETAEALRDVYSTSDVPRPKHAKELTKFIAKRWR